MDTTLVPLALLEFVVIVVMVMIIIPQWRGPIDLFKVISIDGVIFQVLAGPISYSEIVALGGGSSKVSYSIKYQDGPDYKPSGILMPGHSVVVENGMAFSMACTG